MSHEVKETSTLLRSRNQVMQICIQGERVDEQNLGLGAEKLVGKESQEI
jgi:hypothetical protein